MILIHNYIVAVCCFVVCMICWGSWPNTQKLAAKTWRFELFYLDFILGTFITALIAAFTLGSMGPEGRPFLTDIAGAEASSILYAIAGGVVWTLGSLLLTAAMAVAGMSVGFPIGGGLAWIFGIFFNFILVIIDKGRPEGNPVLLFTGVAFIIAAIYFSMLSYRRLVRGQNKTSSKGILLAIAAGLTIAFFYGFVVKSLDNQFVAGGSGTLTPFSGVFFFALGALISTPLFNLVAMRYPVQGEPVAFKEYFKGNISNHLTGVLGGVIWMVGMVLSFMSAGTTNPAISYALSNAAPVVAILWGVLVWKEFKNAPKGTNVLLTAMFSLFLIGLVIITLSNS
jgi:glucose uptake protein